MNIKPIWPLLVALSVISPIHAQEMNRGNAGCPGSSGPAGGPPPEAYTACASRADGDEATMSDPSGESISGVCKPEGNRLVLRPYRNGGGRPRTSAARPDANQE